MSLLDLFMGERPQEPEVYDPRTDPLARPSTDERRKLAVHVDQDAIRIIEIKQMFSQSRVERYYDRVERYRDRKLLLAIIALLIVTKVDDLGQFAAFLSP